MKIAILDDYFDTIRTLDAFSTLSGHDVTIYHDHCDNIDELTKRLKDVEVVVFIRERTAIRSALLENLAKLRLISLRGGFPHIDVDSCTKLGIVVSSNLADDLPGHSAANVTWGLVMGALHRIPQTSGFGERGPLARRRRSLLDG